MNNRLLSMIVLTLAFLLYEEMPAEPADAVPQVLLESADFEMIASTTLDSGYRLDILKTPGGTIVYAESAPITTGPSKLTKDLVNELAPAEVFARVLPSVKVPDSLLAVESIQDLSEPDREGQMSTDTQASGEEQANVHALTEPTGRPDCPAWWFAATFPGCHNNGEEFCLYNAAWAFIYNNKGTEGEGIVCADSGTAQLEVTVGTNLATYMIPAGYYTRVYVSQTTHCGCGCFLCLCFSCDLTDTKFIKFDLKLNGAISQFKSDIYHF